MKINTHKKSDSTEWQKFKLCEINKHLKQGEKNTYYNLLSKELKSGNFQISFM